MTAGSLVSVVIPTYNRGYCIEKTIESVLGQTYRHLEVIVVDDGSTDGTAELLDARFGSEPRLRVLRQPNQGVSAARNRGLRAASGEFIALLDSDDQWLPWKIEMQVACLEAIAEAGMIWTDMDAIGPGGEVFAQRFLTKMYSAYRWFTRDELFERSMPLSGVHLGLAESLGNPRLYLGEIFSQMVLGNLVHTSTVLLRRARLERVGGFDERLLRTGEDFDFHLRTCREGPVAYLDVATVLYQRGRNDQLTVGPENRMRMAENFLRTIAPVIERDRERIRLPRIMLDEVLSEAHAWIGVLHAERGEHIDAWRQLTRSLRFKPRQARVLGFLALNFLPLPVANAWRRLYRGARALDSRRRAKVARP